MGKLFSAKKGLIKKTRFCFLLLCGFISGRLYADEALSAQVFSWDLLWAGHWSGDNKSPEGDNYSAEKLVSHGTLFNRGDLRLDFPRQTLSLRFQALDRRRFPEDRITDFSPAVFNPGFGFYYSGGGASGKILGSARVLRGVLEEQGLSARIRNVWAKSVPFQENRKPFTVDLKNEFSSAREAETCLFLESPRIGYFSGFAASTFDDKLNPAFSGGVEGRWSRSGNFRLDAFYTQKELASQKAASWFSVSPPLPKRDFRLFALGSAFNVENFGFGADAAFSETFAYGKDLYAGAGIRFGSKPWKFSLAADRAGPRYVDRDGVSAGKGFRTAAALERRWIRSGFFRARALLRSAGFGEDFERGSVSFYFRPSYPRLSEIPFWRFTRASISFARDARQLQKTLDSVDLSAAFNFGPVRAVFSSGLCLKSNFEEGTGIIIFRPGFEKFESCRIAGEFGWGSGAFDIRTKLGRTFMAEKDPLWDFYVSSSLRPSRNARFSLKIASPDFPGRWNYTLSWRLEF